MTVRQTASIRIRQKPRPSRRSVPVAFFRAFGDSWLECVAILYALSRLLKACFSGYGPALVGWLSKTCVAFVNAVKFWRIGRHLHAIAHASGVA